MYAYLIWLRPDLVVFGILLDPFDTPLEKLDGTPNVHEAEDDEGEHHGEGSTILRVEISEKKKKRMTTPSLKGENQDTYFLSCRLPTEHRLTRRYLFSPISWLSG